MKLSRTEKKSLSILKWTFAILVMLVVSHALAYEQDVKKKNASTVPPEMVGIGIDQNLGEELDLGLVFRNEKGKQIPLSQLVNGDRPVILSLVYYSCASLCNFHLNGLIDTLKDMKWRPGKEFDVIAVSIDPKESPYLAAAKKENYMKQFGDPESVKGWHFLTGSQESITSLAKKVGFKYKWVPETKEWAHASAAIIVSPTGKISRYLNGIVFNPRDVRLAINEASLGKVGNVIDQLLLYCFRFDPKKNQYSLYAFNVMRAGGGATVLFLLVLIVPMWIRSRRRPGRKHSS